MDAQLSLGEQLQLIHGKLWGDIEVRLLATQQRQPQAHHMAGCRVSQPNLEFNSVKSRTLLVTLLLAVTLSQEAPIAAYSALSPTHEASKL